MTRLKMTDYPLNQEGHTRAMLAWANMDTLSLKHRIIDYHYELMATQDKVRELAAERDLLLQRVECLRPKHPACKCAGHE